MRWLPNGLTLLRLALAVAYFAILEMTLRAQPGDAFADSTLPLTAALVIFSVAGLTDVLDGRLARAWNIQSDFGRIADPLADKILVMGALVYLIPLTAETGPRGGPIVQPWMVVTILFREFAVHGLRSFVESKGVAFGAKTWGKLKMLTQSIFIGIATAHIGLFRGTEWVAWLAYVSAWITVVITAISGWDYFKGAAVILSNRGAAGNAPAKNVESLDASGQ